MVHNRSCVRHLYSGHNLTRRPKALEKQGQALHADASEIVHCFVFQDTRDIGVRIEIALHWALHFRMRGLEDERRAEMVERYALVVVMRERTYAMAFATFDSEAMNAVFRELTSTADHQAQPRFGWRAREPGRSEGLSRAVIYGRTLSRTAMRLWRVVSRVEMRFW